MVCEYRGLQASHLLQQQVETHVVGVLAESVQQLN